MYFQFPCTIIFLLLHFPRLGPSRCPLFTGALSLLPETGEYPAPKSLARAVRFGGFVVGWTQVAAAC